MATETLDAQPRIVAFCNSAKEVVRATYAGHPHDAYNHYLAALEPILPFIHDQVLTNIQTNDLNFFYRVRRQMSPSLTRDNLFHIPFEDRHHAGTQRYSIPGLPCLYFGGSLFTCWAEMGRPLFHELHAAAFWLCEGKTVKILNFSDRPARLLLFVNPEGGVPDDPKIRNLLVKHIVLWPLMAMCSIKVKHRDAPFKPEYIFPQIVLQWITREHQFDGICYFSTHVDAVTNNPLPPCNLVFPAREIKDKGRCDYLRSLFKMTSPHGWQLLSAVQAGEGMVGSAIPDFDFVFVDGRKEPYHKTEFGNVQSKLNKMALDIKYKNKNGEPNLGEVTE